MRGYSSGLTLEQRMARHALDDRRKLYRGRRGNLERRDQIGQCSPCSKPNFLHKGDHVHLGPGVTGTRRTDPAVDLHDLPRIDLICLSHYHASVAPLARSRGLTLANIRLKRAGTTSIRKSKPRCAATCPSSPRRTPRLI